MMLWQVTEDTCVLMFLILPPNSFNNIVKCVNVVQKGGNIRTSRRSVHLYNDTLAAVPYLHIPSLCCPVVLGTS